MSTQNDPLVTVVTVTYNSGKYIRDAVDSILHSSYSNLELIIGDDCSKDETWNIVQTYHDARIIRYRNETNLGEYANRNKAISIATGKYLLFIDGDDMIYPHGLEFMVRMLDAFPQCAMALMRWFRNNLFYPVVITPEQFYTGEYFGHGFLGTAFSNVLFRVDNLRKAGGLSEKYRAGDDFIRYKIAASHPCLIIGDGLTWWRETPGQASQQIKQSLEAFEMKFEFLHSSDCPLTPQRRKMAEQNLYMALAKICARHMLKLRFGSAARIVKRFRIPPAIFLNVGKNIIEIDPFSSFTASNPYRVSFQNNPYSKHEPN